MKKFLGKAIFQDQDEFGKMQVIEDGMFRSLHFDSVEKQSSMTIEDPNELVLTYTRSMMAGFLLKPDASRFLCVGLGGGSIPRFLLNQINNCQVDIIEIRPKVVDIAFDYFYLQNDHRIKVFLGKGGEIIKKQSFQPYDMIFVDAYDKKGISKETITKEFIKDCSKLLKTQGIFSINVWSEPRTTYKATKQSLREIYAGHLLELPVSERTNRILLGIFSPSKNLALVTLKKRAILLEKKMDLEYKVMAKKLIKENLDYFKKNLVAN